MECAHPGSSGNTSGYDWGVFWHGVLHGVRQPGESFAACVANNANQTTFGAVNAVSQKVGDAKVIAAQIVAGTAALASQIRAPGPSVTAMSQVLGVPLQGMTLAQRFGGGLGLLAGGGFAAARLGAAAAQGVGEVAGYGLLFTVDVLAGLAIGSAINCR